MAITLKRRLEIGDATTNPWGGIGTEFDQKPFEKDISWGGYSGLPFVKPLVPKTVSEYFSITTEALSLDYPIRGGSYEEIAARQDFARIDRFVLTYPQGKAFLDKQKGLALSNPKTEVNLVANTEITRFYPNRPVPLFQQLSAGGTGFHYGNLGESGNDLINQANTYGQVASRKPIEENRLYNLWKTKINVGSTSNENQEDLFGIPFSGNLIGEGNSKIANRLGITQAEDSTLMSYLGGPGSRYGIGSTDIFKATDAKGAIIITGRTYPDYNVINSKGPTSINLKGEEVQGIDRTPLQYNNFLGLSNTILGQNFFKDNGIVNGQLPNIDQQIGDGYIRAEEGTAGPTSTPTYFNSTLGYDQLLDQVNENNPREYQDFRKRVIDPTIVASSNYREYNMPKRIGTGDVGIRTNAQRTKVNIIVPSTVDDVNASEINGTINGLVDGEQKTTPPRDLIKFRFQTISNKTGEPTTTTFRAYLTGYTDNHSAEWESKRYTGRGEKFYTYQGNDRSISFNFKVAASTRSEMAPLYRKLNFLLSSLAPDYTSNGFMRGNLTKLTIGDLFVNTSGILQSLNLTVGDNYPWEIAMNEPELGEDTNMQEVPQIIDVAVSFKPIMNVVPQKGESSKILLQGSKWLKKNQLA